MADTSVSFKCPNCTGPLSSVPGQSEIVCEYCGTRLSVADLEAYYARKEEQAAKAEQAKEQKWNTEGAGAAWSEDEQKMLRAFQCPSCGTVNQGRFCMDCGAKKPADAPLYRCDKCGWQPPDPHNPPKFCPQCGDPFDDNDRM